MICARCGKVRGLCAGHEFDEGYGVKEARVPEMPRPRAPRARPYRRHRALAIVRDNTFNCALCGTRHGSGECQVRISHVVIYGQP